MCSGDTFAIEKKKKKVPLSNGEPQASPKIDVIKRVQVSVQESYASYVGKSARGA